MKAGDRVRDLAVGPGCRRVGTVMDVWDSGGSTSVRVRWDDGMDGLREPFALDLLTSPHEGGGEP